MNLRGTLRQAVERLASCVGSPQVEAEVLCGHVLGLDRAGLYTNPHVAIPAEAQEVLNALIARRCAGEPLQYLTGHQAFRHLDLLVGPGVLIPRPETEVVVDHALQRLEGVVAPVVVDVGTGSGAIALSVATERPDARVWATDASPAAATWARRNLAACGAGNLTMWEGDLLSPLPVDLRGRVDLVVSNPPYLSEAELAEVAPEVRDHEPRAALVSGPSGLEVAQRLAAEALAWLRPGAWLVLETSPIQAAALQGVLTQHYEEVGVYQDLAGRPRVLEGRSPAGAAGQLAITVHSRL